VLAACSSSDEADTNRSACDGTISEVQELVSRSVNHVPGFAGCAPDPENSGGYVVNVTSPGVDLEEVRAEIIAQDEPSAQALQDADLRAVQVDVSGIDEWYREAHNRLLTELPVEHQSDWRWWYGDPGGQYNQALFGYEKEEARSWAQQFILDNIDAPPGVVVAFQMDPGEED
jgi:hypothetical protein